MQPLDEYCLSQYRPLPVKARSDSGFLDIGECSEELYPSFDDVSNLYLALDLTFISPWMISVD